MTTCMHICITVYVHTWLSWEHFNYTPCTRYFLSNSQIQWLTRSFLQVLHIKKYDYMHTAVIYVYISSYRHIYVGFKTPGCPSTEQKETALARRKPLAPEDKKVNKPRRYERRRGLWNGNKPPRPKHRQRWGSSNKPRHQLRRFQKRSTLAK